MFSQDLFRGCLLVLEKMKEFHRHSLVQILGAYCSTDWAERKKVEKKNLQYFGTGETFLFTLAPKRVRNFIFCFVKRAHVAEMDTFAKVWSWI